MKCRSGFVSNSSSSSFVIWGVKIRRDVTCKELLERMFDADEIAAIARDTYQKGWAELTENEIDDMWDDLKDEAGINVIFVGDDLIVGDGYKYSYERGYIASRFTGMKVLQERANIISQQFKGLYDGDVGLHIGTCAC